MLLNLLAVLFCFFFFFFFKQKTAYEMRISDWSSDVCSSDLVLEVVRAVDRIRVRHNVGAEEVDEVLGINGITDCYRDNLNAVALDVGLVVVVVFNFISAFVHLAVTEEEQPVDGIRKSGEIGRASCRERMCQYV